MARSIAWQLGTIADIRRETPRVQTFRFALPGWVRHRAGQRYDVRLRSPDGYVAQRSYSIGSPPELEGAIELTIERLEDGEVSGYLHDVAAVGDIIELRGPIGGHFIWDAKLTAPLLLVAGGSGIVPLMCMLRHRRHTRATNPTRLLFSVRSAEELIYRDEHDSLVKDGSGLEVTYTLTRQQPMGWTGYRRRIDASMLAEIARPLGPALLAYVCGPTPMVEAAASGLVDIGIDPKRIRTERFGPS
jgi:ferredoxin-NADP reductase